MASADEEGLPPERLPRDLTSVRFYVDEDLTPVGNAMMWARRDVVVCGNELVRTDLPRGQWDENWIPKVAAHGWIAITANDKIRRNPVESKIAVDHKLRALCPQDRRGDLSMWDKLSSIAAQWSEVERFVDLHPSGPWWLSITKSGTRELPYAALSS